MAKILGSALLVLGMAIQGAYASEQCSQIQSDSDRLACYDLQYKPAVSQAKKTAWNVTESQSKMDDSKTVVLHVESDEQIRKSFGGSETADLYIRCQEGKTSLYFVIADRFLATVEGYGKVDYRLDSEKPRSQEMDVSTDNKALGMWGASAISFAKKLIGHDSLVVRVTPYNESPVTATFKIAGLDEALKPLRAVCKW